MYSSQSIPSREDNPNSSPFKHFVDADTAAAFLASSRKHVLRLSMLGKIPAHPLPGSGQRKTWRYLLSELRDWVLSCDARVLGPQAAQIVISAAGGSRKGG